MNKSKKKSTEKKKVTIKLQATAYHEAGHAMVCWKLGVGIIHVTIIPKAESLGHILRHNILKEDDENDNSRAAKSRFEKAIKVCFAGPEAEKKFTGRGNHTGAAGDYENALELVSHISGDSKLVGLFLKLMSYQVECLIKNNNNWRAIKALAKALLEKETISGKNAKEIMERAFMGDHYVPAPKSTQPKVKYVSRKCPECNSDLILEKVENKRTRMTTKIRAVGPCLSCNSTFEYRETKRMRKVELSIEKV